MCQWLKSKEIAGNPKAILPIMKKYNLLAEIRRRRKWKQIGQQLHRYENLLNRNFVAERPNQNGLQTFPISIQKQYFNLTQEYGITPSMSGRGNCYDNSIAGNFLFVKSCKIL